MISDVRVIFLAKNKEITSSVSVCVKTHDYLNIKLVSIETLLFHVLLFKWFCVFGWNQT